MNKFLEEVKGEEVEFKYARKERKLTPLTLEQVRKRKDGYYTIAVQSGGTLRKAIVPENTIIRMIEEGTSPKVLRDRCNTLSALGNDFDKPLMYYAIVAYNLVPESEWKKWVTSRPLLDYELIHLNGDIDDIRKDNVRLTIKNEKLWNEVKTEYKTEQKVGADKEYTRSIGINKKYNLTSLEDINNITIYYVSSNNDNNYYIPVTKYINTKDDKIKIIIEELSSSSSYQSNLMSYLNYDTKLISYDLEDNELNLYFNDAIINKGDDKILEEVIYSISYSMKDSINVDNIHFYVNDKEFK